jgi:hypothetical protein
MHYAFIMFEAPVYLHSNQISLLCSFAIIAKTFMLSSSPLLVTLLTTGTFSYSVLYSHIFIISLHYRMRGMHGMRAVSKSFYYLGLSDKSLAFPIFLFAAQTKEFFLAGLKKLEGPRHSSGG